MEQVKTDAEKLAAEYEKPGISSSFQNRESAGQQNAFDFCSFRSSFGLEHLFVVGDGIFLVLAA